MQNIIKFLLKYPLWDKMIMIILIVFGVFSVLSLTSSFFPERDSRNISIQLMYPGASPEEIEEGAVLKIEENIRGIEGIERFTSASMENTATITVEVFRNYDVDEVLQDVKNAVNSINSFPVDMESPVIFKARQFDMGISFSLSGDVDLLTLKKTAEQVEDDLIAIDGISQIEISGYPEQEIVVYVDEENLRNYELNFDDIANAIRNANLEITSGNIRTDNEELLIKFKSKEYYAKGFEDIVVRSNDGKTIRLSDVATLRDKWEEDPERSYLNGKPGVMVAVNKTIDEDILQIAEEVKKYIENFNKNNKIIQAHIIFDATKPLKDRIFLLMKNGMIGFVLVLIALTFFINLRLAFWVAVAIPLSFAGMFILAPLSGITINVISLFGMIIVVGILVDDGIIIGENIYQHFEKGKAPGRAVIDGTMEVLPSVFAAIVTTMIAFLPFYFLDGRMGDFMRDMAFVVIVTIAMSLLEGATLLPVHIAHGGALRDFKKKTRFRKITDRYLQAGRERLFAPSLRYFLKNKLLILAIVAATVMITLGAFKGSIIKTTYFPYIDSDIVNIEIIMKPGTRENITKSVLDRIEQAAWDVNKELKESNNGFLPITDIKKDISKGRGAHTGFLQIIMQQGEDRSLESYVVANAIREKVGPIYGAEQVSFGGGSFHFGKPVSISLVSADLNELHAAKNELEQSLNTLEELKDIVDNDMVGLREVNLELKEKAYLLGLTRAEIARQIRQGFFGEEVQRIQRGRDEVKVWVRYSDEGRSSVNKLENMRIRMMNGNEFPLSELVDYSISRSSAVINHLNGKRVIRVDADVTDQRIEMPALSERINRIILAPLLAKYPTVSTTDDGQKREINKTMKSSRKIIPIALLGMLIVIVLSFRSFWQALLVFILIPLGLIGASWGHFLFDMPVSMMSYYGIIALMGIIVNDSIVFVNAININLKAGLKFEDAVYEAGLSRFRPILLTTFTTFFGLAPLIFETSRQAQFLIPMAISVAYGLLFATFLILIVLPVMVIVLNYVRRYFYFFWNGVYPEPEVVEPAVREIKRINAMKDDVPQKV